jgi:hypothetical protein
MLADIERFSPEAVMRNWLAAGPQSAEQMQEFFRGIFSPPGTGRYIQNDLVLRGSSSLRTDDENHDARKSPR